MITYLDHVALAVNDFDTAVDGYRRFFDREPLWVEREGGTQMAWFQLRAVGLLLVAADASDRSDAVRHRLAASGEGLWSLAFAVDNVDRAQTQTQRRGLTPITHPQLYTLGSRDPRPCFGIDPEDTGSVIITLIQEAALEDFAAKQFPQDPGAVEGLDHVVIRTQNPDRAAAIYGARLGLDLRLDRSNQAWGVRQLFFRCGETVVEIVTSLTVEDEPTEDRFDGLAWKVGDASAIHTRLSKAAFDVSAVRSGRKQGSKVLTLRSGLLAAPALMIEQGQRHDEPSGVLSRG